MKSISFMGEEIQPVFTLEFDYHDSHRKVENATVKRDKGYSWLIVGLEVEKNEERTEAIKSYKFEDAENVQLIDVYEYEGE